MTIIQQLLSQNIQPLEIRKQSKAPIANGWNTPTDFMNYEEVGVFLEEQIESGEANLGILCGKFSGIIGVDIDSNDEDDITKVIAILGDTPCIKKGNKGCTLFYSYNGEVSQKLYLSSGTGHIDILSSNDSGAGTNTVIPPSIHPDTLLPYEWVGEVSELDKESLPKISKRSWAKLISENVIEKTRAVKKSDTKTDSYVRGSYQDKPEVYEAIHKALEFVSPDCSYEDWRNIGFAINYSITGEEGAELFLEWSNRSQRYKQQKDNNTKVAKDIFFNAHLAGIGGGQITTSTLFKYVSDQDMQNLPEPIRQTIQSVQYDLTIGRHHPDILAEPGFVYDYSNFPHLEGQFTNDHIAEMIKQRFYDDFVYVTDGVSIAAAKLYHKNSADNTVIEVTSKNVSPISDCYHIVLEELIKSAEFLATCTDKDGVYSHKVYRKKVSIMMTGAFSTAVESRFLKHGSKFLNIPRSEFDSTPYYISDSENRLIDLRLGQQVDYPKNYLSFKNMPVEYDPTATCEEWIDTLHQIFANNREPQACVDFIQELFGYCLTGEVNLQQVYVFYGSGANGKSVVTDALRMLLGSGTDGYACVGSSNDFKHSRGFEKEMGLLIGKSRSKRATIIPDISVGSSWNDEMVKAITEKTGQARILYSDSTSIKMTSKFIFACNELPTINRENGGIARRIKILTFERKFVTKNNHHTQGSRQSHIDSILDSNLPGILNWAIEGAVRYYDSGKDIIIPQEMELDTNEYVAENSPITESVQFVCGDPDDPGAVFRGFGELKDKLRIYFNSKGYYDLIGMSDTRVGKVLRDVGYIKRRMRTGYEYLVVLKEFEEPEDFE